MGQPVTDCIIVVQREIKCKKLLDIKLLFNFLRPPEASPMQAPGALLAG